MVRRAPNKLGFKFREQICSYLTGDQFISPLARIHRSGNQEREGREFLVIHLSNNPFIESLVFVFTTLSSSLEVLPAKGEIFLPREPTTALQN